jgi:hypothetical protein
VYDMQALARKKKNGWLIGWLIDVWHFRWRYTGMN